MLFDSHAHLNDPQYAGDLSAVLKRAQEAGVGAIVDIGYDRKTIARSREISEANEWIYSAFGFHPHEANQISDSDFDWLREQLQYPKCVALGEIGLDAVKNYSPMDVQQKVLHRLMELAGEIGKPVIFHSRGKEKEVLDTAISAHIEKAVFHCYTGDIQTARLIWEQGYYLSFAGFVTFPKGFPSWLAEVPRDRILIETDCPYLAPVPNRGKRNEPAFLAHTCQRIAEHLQISAEEFARLTTENAKRFYNI